jgi:DNA-binding transcriptional LysR family regulator
MRSIKNTAQNIKKSEFGSISLGVSPALGFDVIPNVISRFHKDYPNVTFDIQTIHNDDMMQTLLEHKCDLAVLFSPKTLPGLTSVAVAQSELVIVYPKAKFPHCPEKLTLDDVCDLEFIDISDSGPLAEMLWARIMEEDINFKSKIKVQTYFIAARLVARGLGVCVVDRFTAEGNLSDNVAIASFEPTLAFHINAVHLENRKSSKVIDEFMPYLTQGF